MLSHIRHTVDTMGGLGFEGKATGTHSIRSSLAIALYLAKQPITTIMLLRRWSSDAFLLDIRRQVQEFSAGVSEAMLSCNNYFTIPVIDNDPTQERRNPRTRISLSFANTISLNGPNATTAHRQRTAMHVWH